MKLHHIGLMTENPVLFEAFWCTLLGFKRLRTFQATKEKMNALFQINEPAIVASYLSPEEDFIIEYHYCYKSPRDSIPSFRMPGFNHLCIEVGSLGSREQFLSQHPEIVFHRYLDPQGWTLIFIQDFEGNWIELREKWE